MPQTGRVLAGAPPLREQARLLTLSFGVTFSVLLGLIYASTATLLSGAAHRIAEQHIRNPAAHRDRLVAFGIESDWIGKLGRITATFSPLVAGLLSSLIGARG